MPKTAEKTAEATLPLEGVAPEAQQGPSAPAVSPARRSRALAHPSPASPARSEHQAMLDMISAAAANPKVNVDKLERLLAMRDRAVAAEREQAFNNAMAAAQAEMEPVRVDSANPETKSKYASYAALDRAIRPIYSKHGLALSFNTEPATAPEMMTVVCYVTGCGHTRKYTIDMPTDGKGPKGGSVMSRTHATGAGATYGQRYLMKMIFNIAVDRDDDGNAAGRTVINNVNPDVPKITKDQIIKLHDKCDAVGCPRKKFLEWAQVARFEDIPADTFEGCMVGLDTFRKKS
jgi:hypothetical protein